MKLWNHYYNPKYACYASNSCSSTFTPQEISCYNFCSVTVTQPYSPLYGDSVADCVSGQCNRPEEIGVVCVDNSSGTYWEFQYAPVCYGSYPPTVPLQPVVDNSSPKKQCGSIIKADKLTVSEKMPLVNTPFSLIYSSDKVAGYTQRNHLRIPITQSSVDTGETGITLSINVAGQVTTQTFPVSPNQVYDYVWNGLDGSGNPVSGSPVITYSVTNAVSPSSPNYYGPPTYFPAPSYNTALGMPPTRTAVGGSNPIVTHLGLGGWTVNVLHSYDGNAQILHLGTGETANVGYYQTGTSFYVGSSDGSELYVFD